MKTLDIIWSNFVTLMVMFVLLHHWWIESHLFFSQPYVFLVSIFWRHPTPFHTSNIRSGVYSFCRSLLFLQYTKFDVLSWTDAIKIRSISRSMNQLTYHVILCIILNEMGECHSKRTLFVHTFRLIEGNKPNTAKKLRFLLDGIGLRDIPDDELKFRIGFVRLLTYA